MDLKQPQPKESLPKVAPEKKPKFDYKAFVLKYYKSAKVFILKNKYTKIGSIAVLIILLFLLIFIPYKINSNKGFTKEVSEVYKYEINLPDDFESQEDVLGNVTLTEREQGPDGQCIIHIVQPKPIAEDTGLETWIRSYLGDRDERFDYNLADFSYKKMDDAKKITIKSSSYKDQDWYFMRKDNQVMEFHVWLHGEGDKNCQDFLALIVK